MGPQTDTLPETIRIGAPPAPPALPPEDRYHTEAPPELPDERFLVLKHNDSFAVFNGHGDFAGGPHSKQGLFVGGTRHLSGRELRLNGRRPLLLGAAVTRDSTRVVVDLMSPDIDEPESLCAGEVHVFRAMRLWNGLLAERLAVTNYGRRVVDVRIILESTSDFADVFEVRGMRRRRRGEVLAPMAEADSLTLSYRGLDDVTRRTHLRASPAPARVWPGGMEFHARLAPGARTRWHLTISPEHAPTSPAAVFAETARRLRQERDDDRARCCGVSSGNDLLNEWIERSLADLSALTTRTPHGPYPFAGIPWYSCPFGRDGIITALQTLWVNPDWARGVLSFLASVQADRHDEAGHAEPGKILHEMREGEMPALGEVPFGRYYGTVDATPLFVALAGHYFHHTADAAFIRSLWPHVERALAWMAGPGDPDGDGLLEYRNDWPSGLHNQGWKDSHDAVFLADGAEPPGPIALCEVQGYAYDAWRQAARLAAALDLPERAREFRARARALRERFEELFWDAGLGAYAMALCGDKRRCLVLASNAGHVLASGIATREHARIVARAMMGPRMFTGWGIRTVARGEARYNPMSYHNGSVWPHDNGMIALGMARYGLRRPAARLLRSWLDASNHLDLRRLPELICGFDRAHHHGPVLYPVACSPQAWAAGAVFMLLQACLGLAVDGRSGIVQIRRPILPRSVDSVTLRQVRVGGATVDLAFRQGPGGTDATVIRKDPGVRVVVRS